MPRVYGGELVYAIGCADGTGAVKFGTSDSVFERLRTLQRMNTHELRILGVRPGGIAVERMLHTRYAHRRCWGEFHQLSREELAAVLAECMPWDEVG
jgi:hypothetical protein